MAILNNSSQSVSCCNNYIIVEGLACVKQTYNIITYIHANNQNSCPVLIVAKASLHSYALWVGLNE